jgi:hypothetical protein
MTETDDKNADHGAQETIEQRRDDMLRKALATPPISNEDILKRSKESHRK